MKALVDKELGPLLDRPALGVQLDADDVAAVAQEGLLKLGQPDLGVATAEAFVDHHLLAVVGPALGVGPAIEQFPDLGREPPGVEELEVVAGIGLVDVDHRHDRRVVEPEVFLDVLLVPVFLDRSDVIKRLGRAGLVRSGRVHRGERPARA